MIGCANIANPTADGNAMIILNLTAIVTLSLIARRSPVVTDATKLGIIEDAIAVDTAIGTLTNKRYFVL